MTTPRPPVAPTVTHRRGDTNNVTAWLMREDYDALEAFARKHGISKSQIVREAVREYLKGKD